MIQEESIEGTYVGFTPFELHDGKAWIVGTFQHVENRICVSNADCEGRLKDFMDYLVMKFKTNRILVYNVLSSNWHLREFERCVMTDPIFNEDVLCLQGDWEINS